MQGPRSPFFGKKGKKPPEGGFLWGVSLGAAGAGSGPESPGPLPAGSLGQRPGRAPSSRRRPPLPFLRQKRKKAPGRGGFLWAVSLGAAGAGRGLKTPGPPPAGSSGQRPGRAPSFQRRPPLPFLQQKKKKAPGGGLLVGRQPWGGWRRVRSRISRASSSWLFGTKTW